MKKLATLIQRLRSAGFQACCVADFQVGRPAERMLRRQVRNLRYSRLGSLRYAIDPTMPDRCGDLSETAIRSASPQSASIIHHPLSIILSLALTGCHSAPPPPAPPPAVAMAERAEQQAATLSEQQQNWPAAMHAWQLAADRFSLLNDITGEATALHNLAQAERELGQNTNAHTHLEQATSLNEKAGRTLDWWRNQIALLQLEAESGQTNALKFRFENLLPLAAKLSDPFTHGLFLNELGVWQMTQDDPGTSEKTFADAEKDFRAAHSAEGLAAITANRAELHASQKNFPSAVADWKSALAQFEKLAEPEGVARALAGEGRTLFEARQDLSTAEQLLRRAARNYQLLGKTEKAKATLALLTKCVAEEKRSK